MGYWQYPKYVPVAQKKEKAAKKLKQLQKKNKNINPIIIEGRTIARTWWGKSWTVNLERYADYANRIGRGRSYVCHGAVLDLQIKKGIITSLVQGSTSRPYEISIKIKEISKKDWQRLTRECEGKIDSLQELLIGKFPKALQEIFMSKEQGLFPSPKEINFSCSCPDWASMCKHVAATLYGVGARLDENPALFFELRGADVNDLISKAVADTTQNLLQKANRKTDKIMENADLSDLFGIDLESNIDLEKPQVRLTEVNQKKSSSLTSPGKTRQKTSIKTNTQKDRKALKTKPPKPVPVKTKKQGLKSKLKKVDQKTTTALALDQVVKIICRSKKGVDIPTLIKKTGLENKKLYNIIFKLKKEGRIRSIARGIYGGV